MQYAGMVARIIKSRSEITLIVDTEYGPRGIELDSDLWTAILTDAGLEPTATITGWRITYDTDTGDLEVFQPEDDESSS
ncbi:MAG TPA: hypothetical protein VHP83_06530 [Aggregatilineaceae bacterium]|nr:hypothetical protein [Aggregatilineaceae bacterium]